MAYACVEQKARRVLQKNGYQLHKSRAKRWSYDNQLGYMIVNGRTNLIVCGNRYDMTLNDVVNFSAS